MGHQELRTSGKASELASARSPGTKGWMIEMLFPAASENFFPAGTKLGGWDIAMAGKTMGPSTTFFPLPAAVVNRGSRKQIRRVTPAFISG